MIYDNLEIVSESDNEVLSLSDVKNFLKVSGNKDDALISQLIRSAIKKAESFCSIAIINKTYSIVFPRIDCNKAISFPIYKVSKVTKVYVKNSNNCDEKELDSSNYCFDIDSQLLTIQNTMLYIDRIKVIFETTFNHDSSNFDDLKQALYMHINLLYKQRLASLDSKELDIDARIAGLYGSLRSFKL